MKARSICVAMVIAVWSARSCGQVPVGHATHFVVPVVSSNVDGNTYSVLPFWAESYRYQQVYAASEFASLTNYGGGWVADVLFRADTTNARSAGVRIPAIKVNLSTTSRGADQLSAAFAENVGADDTTVFSGVLQTSAEAYNPQGPQPFEFLIDCANRFLYRPALGNLLLDVTITQGNSPCTNFICPQLYLDACNSASDSVSRVYWGDANASTGLVDSLGLVTLWTFWPNPKLEVEPQTNSFSLIWPANPDTFVLQSKSDLGLQSNWQTVTDGIGTVSNGYVKTFTLPWESAGKEAYFRLISPAPP